MTQFRQGKARLSIEDGKRVFEWPIESRLESYVSPLGSIWEEVAVYPTRLKCRAALKKIRTEEQVRQARLART